MEYLTTILDYAIPFLVVLTVLVFFHELGHYLVARYNGVRVEVFSVGFGPELFGYTDRSGTRWKFSAVPLGGYVKMFGENTTPGDVDQSPMTPEEESVAFNKKSIGQDRQLCLPAPQRTFSWPLLSLLYCSYS
jgi:regulator of sigma E protease